MMTDDPNATPARPEKRRRRRLGLSPAGVVLLLALVGVAAYLFSPVLSEQFGQNRQPTPSPPAVAVTPLRPAETRASAETPSASELSPAEFGKWLAQAEALTLQSRFEEALAIYEDLARREPDDARPETGWAWAFLLDDQPDLALEHARRAVELDPVRAGTTGVLARAYLAVGDADRALAMAEGAVQLDERDAEAHAVLAEVYRLGGQMQKAVEEADLALAQDTNSAAAHQVRGWLYHAVDGDVERALAELQAAADLQPELWLRQYELGLLLLEAEDYDAALVALINALALRPKAAIYTSIGEAYYHLGEYERARSFLEQALWSEAGEADTYALLAAIHAQEGRCDESGIYSEQALAQDPASLLALEAVGICQGTPTVPTPTPDAPAPAPLPPPPSGPTLGGRLAFPVWNAEEGNYDTYVAEAQDGSGRRLIAAETHQPAFSPDGQWLAVNGEQHLRENLLLVRPDGSGVLEITEHTEDGLPAWSPDAKRLVFSSTRHGDRQSRVYVIDPVPLDGRRARGRPLIAGPDDVRGADPTWTTGGQVVYSGCDYTTTPVQCGLLLMPSGPGAHTPTPLTSHPGDTAPAAHGDKIAFMSERDGNWEIYVVNVDGSGLQRLTDHVADDGLPTWSPDGETLAFVSDRDGVWAVWAMSPDGSNQRKLFDIGGGGLVVNWQQEQISWSPN